MKKKEVDAAPSASGTFMFVAPKIDWNSCGKISAISQRPAASKTPERWNTGFGPVDSP